MYENVSLTIKRERLMSLPRLCSDLRSLKSAADWQQALEDARVDGQKNPLPLEVFKVSLWFVLKNLGCFHVFSTFS